MNSKTVSVELNKEEISALLVAIDADMGNVFGDEHDMLVRLDDKFIKLEEELDD